jgi:head-tail adaptor
MSKLIHPRLVTALAEFFPQSCAIQQPSISRDAVGGEIRTYADVTGLSAVGCRVAPAQGGEQRTNEMTYLDATHRIVLAGSYPQITEAMRAVVGGQAYDILLPAVDADAAITRLTVRLVR